MIQSIKVTNVLGESLVIPLENPSSVGFSILHIDGLGPPKAQINTTAVLTLDGGVFNSSRVDGRNIVLKLLLLPQPTIEDARLALYQYFAIKQPMTFQIETDDRTAEVVGYVESNEPDIFSKQETTVVSIVCPDAYFHDTEIQYVTFSGVGGGFQFPFSNESLTEPLIEFGVVELSTEKSVYYDGDAPVGMIFNIHATGTVEDLLIHNSDTGGSILIDDDRLTTIVGSSISSGDDIRISTIKGQKSITLTRAGIEYNILNALDRDTEWFQLVRGDNLFLYNASAGVANLQFEIEYQLLYEGV